MNNAQIVTAIYQSLFGRNPELAGLQFFVAQLESGAQNINTIAINILDGAQNEDADVVANKIAAAEAWTAAVAADPDALAAYQGQAGIDAGVAFLAGITDDESTIPTEAELDAALSLLIAGEPPAGTPGETFTLTIGTDAGPAFTGGDGDDVFQADVVQTGLLPNQTLNSTDNLDGGGGWNTLNAQLVDPNVTPAGLSNIQEINISSAPGVAAGLVNLLAAPRLNAINADSVEVLGFSALYNDVAIDNLDAGLTDINISNSGLGFFGDIPDIDVNLIGDNLGGEEDELNINLVNAQVTLDVDYDGLAEDQGYEVINIDSAGSDPNGNALVLEGSALAAHTVNVTGGTDLGLADISLANLRTFTAAALAASLTASFGGAAEEDGEIQTVEITGAQGDNTLTFEDTTGNLVIETFDGDDEITVHDHEGDIDITTNDGDDTVSLHVDRFNSEDEGEGITLDLGEGRNTLSLSYSSDWYDLVQDLGSADISFAEADISNVHVLVLEDDLTADSLVATIDLEGLDDIEEAVFEGDVLVQNNSVLTFDNAPGALVLTTEGSVTIDTNGRIIVNDVEDLVWNAEQGATIQGGGTLELSDAVNVTLNVGNASATSQVVFTYDVGGEFVGDDLETFTVNLIDGADGDGATYVGPSTLDSSSLSLETVVVNGSEDSNFTMSFHPTSTPEITTIDLSDFAGQATITMWDFGPDAYENNITITMGSGDLTYNQGSDGRETFVFTEDFGAVVINDFTSGDGAAGDRLDVSSLGITQAGQLDFIQGDWVAGEFVEDGAGSDLQIVAAGDQFDGEIVLLGRGGDQDEIALYNLIYA